MGIVYNRKQGRGYISKPKCQPVISRQRTTKVLRPQGILTRQNINFLKSLGFRIKVGGK